MCIPKTSASLTVPEKENGQTKSQIVAFFQQPIATLRAPIACSLLVASLAAPVQSHAVPLNASALAGTDSVSFMTAPNSTSTPPGDGTREARLRFDSAFLEADITDFASQRAQRHTGKDKDSRLAELGSFGVSSVTVSSIPLQNGEDRENNLFRGGGSATAGMPVMAIVWLFAIGLIGIGTVGRRKQPKP